MNSFDHFRYIVDVEAERLVGLAPSTGETFVRKALADTIERLNHRLRELGGVPIVESLPARPMRQPARTLSIATVQPMRTRSETVRTTYGDANRAHMRITEDALSSDAMGELVNVVAAALGVDAAGVTHSNREQRFSYARQMSMHLAYTVFGVSSTRIARYFGKRDHTTVLYGRDRIQADLDDAKIDGSLWEQLVGQVREIGQRHGLLRTKEGRAPNAVPVLMAVSA